MSFKVESYSLKKNPSHISEYNYFCQLSTRWNDNDIYGHMNNIIYYALFDTAVNKWLIKNKLIDIKSGQNIGLIVQSGCNYFSSFEYPENINAGIRVTKIGKSSVRYEVGLFKEKEELSSADGFFIHVYVDRKTNKPIALDYNFKNVLDTIFVKTEI
jgi:acyl-CoA thioester hydrolase